MPDISPRFLLTVPTQPDPFVTVDIADNLMSLDEKVSGYLIGLAGSRPAAEFINRGFFYLASDTGTMSFSNGTEWLKVRDISTAFGYSVMVFANAAARNSALSGALAEGMVAYLQDTKLLYRFDGSAWQAVGDDASQLTTGTLPVDRGVTSGSATAGVPKYNGTVQVDGMFYGGTATPTGTIRINYSGALHATTVTGDGAGLTSINASALASGSVPVDRGQTAGAASAGVPKYNGTTEAAGMFYGGTTTPSNTTRLNYSGNLHAAQFIGSAAGLTAIPAENLTGTINNARIPVITRKSVVTSNTSATLSLDFASGDEIIRSTRAGSLAFEGTNYTAGISKTVVWNGGNSSRAVSFPAGWVFVSFKPTTLAADKRGVLTVTCHGTTEADCTAAWASEA